MTKIEQIEHFQTRVHRFCLLMPIGDSHHHTLYIMLVQGSNHLKSPVAYTSFEIKSVPCGNEGNFVIRVQILPTPSNCCQLMGTEIFLSADRLVFNRSLQPRQQIPQITPY